MRALADLLDTISRIVATITRVACVAVLFVMLGLLATQVVARYVFDAPPTWTEELAITLFAWLVLMFATVGVREGFHVAVDFLTESSPAILRHTSDRIILVLAVVLGVALTMSGWRYVIETGGQMSAAMQYPIEALHAAAPVCGILVVLHAVARFFKPDIVLADD